MKLNDFDYDLPKELIAQVPCERRDISRMLCLDKDSHRIEHKRFYDIVDLLSENDVLVMNNTKVIPARLIGEKEVTKAKIEVFLLKNIKDKEWEVLIKPSKRIKSQTRIKISEELSAIALERKEDGNWIIELEYEGNIFEIIDKIGNLPLPPYIERTLSDNQLKNLDYQRYQTVFAQTPGSVAAPTAGLHFTEEILEKLSKKGVQICYVTLKVGLGTFRPVKCENILEHKMHSEEYEIPEQTAKIINTARATGKNIVAVGTTSVRTLETAFQQNGKISATKGESKLFIYPGYKFNVVNKILTNFHLPKSTLLMLVSAFAGKEFIFEAYNEAITEKYRFFSYGDCMFLQ